MTEPKYRCHRCGQEWAEEMDPAHFLSCPNVGEPLKGVLDHIMAGGWIGRMPDWDEIDKGKKH